MSKERVPNTYSRRDFLKGCTAMALGVVLAPEVSVINAKPAQAQEITTADDCVKNEPTFEQAASMAGGTVGAGLGLLYGVTLGSETQLIEEIPAIIRVPLCMGAGTIAGGYGTRLWWEGMKFIFIR